MKNAVKSSVSWTLVCGVRPGMLHNRQWINQRALDVMTPKGAELALLLHRSGQVTAYEPRFNLTYIYKVQKSYGLTLSDVIKKATKDNNLLNFEGLDNGR